MSNAAFSFTPDATTIDILSVDDAFRGRILAAVRDLRAREKRASFAHAGVGAAACGDLRLGDAANDSAAHA